MSSWVLPAGLPQPAPAADGLDAPYWAGTREHQLRVQRCGPCGTWQWGPEWVCHRCRSRHLDWPAVEPHGRVFSWERVWHPVHPALVGRVPYVVLLVEVPHAGGVRLLGNLVGDPTTDVIIGDPMTAVFEDHDDGDPPFTLVQWAPAGAGRSSGR